MASKQGMLKKRTTTKTSSLRAKTNKNKPAPDFSGTFIGCINCAPTMLVIRQQKTKVQGKLDIAGNIYTLYAECGATGAEGEISTQLSRDTVACSLSCRDNRLTLKLQVPDPVTGQTLDMPVRFQRKNSPQLGNGRDLLNAVQEQLYCDPVLIGNWEHQDTVTEVNADNKPRPRGKVSLQMKKNGEYRLNAETLPTLHFRDASNDSDISSGRWQSRDRVIYLSDPDKRRWHHYARYHVKGARLYLTFSDGSNELWCKT